MLMLLRRNENSRDIKILFPRAKISHVPGAGHWVHYEKPNEFIQVLLQFLLQS